MLSEGAGEGSGIACVVLRQKHQPGPREKRNTPVALPAAPRSAGLILTRMEALWFFQTPLTWSQVTSWVRHFGGYTSDMTQFAYGKAYRKPFSQRFMPLSVKKGTC